MADPSGIYSYRGQRNADWLLQSGATRRLVQEYGDSILTDPEFPELYLRYHRETLLETARARGYDVDSGRKLSDLELLAKLQHLGAPTGLLDFSWSPLVALWFACIDPNNDGKLFMVNTNDAVSVIRLDNDLAAEGLTTVLTEVATPPRIFYWEPAVAGEAAHRIVRQRSVFIIGPPLGLVDDRMTSHLLIPQSDKEQLLAELAVLDYDHESALSRIFCPPKSPPDQPLEILNDHRRQRPADRPTPVRLNAGPARRRPRRGRRPAVGPLQQHQARLRRPVAHL